MGPWYAQFGASLPAKWNMPAAFALVARHHHDAAYETVADVAIRHRLRVVNLANRMVQAGGGPSVDDSVRALGLTDGQLERLEARVAEVEREVVGLVG